jgi:hypothetical protein
MDAVYAIQTFFSIIHPTQDYDARDQKTLDPIS